MPQPPLFDILPPAAVRINRLCWIWPLENESLVYVGNVVIHTFDPSDAPYRNFVIASLVKEGHAKQAEVARAFGCHRNHVGNCVERLREEGLDGVFPRKPGPKEGSKVTREMRRFMIDLAEAGYTQEQIAVRVEEDFGVTIDRSTVGRHLRQRGRGRSSKADKAPPEPGRESHAPVEPTFEFVDAVGASPAPKWRPSAWSRYAGALVYLIPVSVFGLVEVGQKWYGELKGARLYGFREMVLSVFLMCVLRFRTVEDFKRVVRRDFGVLIGRGQSPSLRTLRRRLQELAAAASVSESFLRDMARRYLDIELVRLGVFYIDGHVKVYYGTRNLPKVWCTKLRGAQRGIEQYFVHGEKGRPLFFLEAEPDQTMVDAIKDIVLELKQMCGGAGFTVVFDRGGYSGPLFKWLMAQGVDFITYRKNFTPRYSKKSFRRSWVEVNGTRHRYLVRDGSCRVSGCGRLRQVMVLDGTHQISVITSNRTRRAPVVVYLLFHRWSQENSFKHGIEAYNIDAIVTHEGEEAGAEVMVTNPHRKRLERERDRLKRAIEKARQAIWEFRSQGGADDVAEAEEKLFEELETLEVQAGQVRERLAQTPKKTRNAELDRKVEVMKGEQRVLVNTLKVGAYNAEEWLLEHLADYYPDNRDRRKCLQAIVDSPGEVRCDGETLEVILDGPDLPSYARAAEGLFDALNERPTMYPGTELRLRFGVTERVHKRAHKSVA